MAKLAAKGTPMARLNSGIDGGMNKVFAAKLPNGNTGLSDGGEGQSLSLLALARAPGTIPSHVNPPHAPNLEQPAVERGCAGTVDPGGDRDAGRDRDADHVIRRLLHELCPQGRVRRRRRPRPPPARRRPPQRSRNRSWRSAASHIPRRSANPRADRPLPGRRSNRRCRIIRPRPLPSPRWLVLNRWCRRIHSTADSRRRNSGGADPSGE